VGWCQYGRRGELPRLDHSRNYQSLSPKDENEKLWRITCFVVDKNYRKSGVASTALKAALESIRKKGGGLVEAIPVRKTDQGPGYMYTGTVSMFEKAGFKIVGPFGTGRTSTVVMRRVI
jgi:ribosomal protein S18 acetylase RimI-like enzyme